MDLCCRDRARFKVNLQLRKLPPFSISRTSSCYLEAARFLALIRSNGYVLVEPEKCLEPSLLTSTDSHVFWQEDSREQRGAPGRPSSLHSAGSRWQNVAQALLSYNWHVLRCIETLPKQATRMQSWGQKNMPVNCVRKHDKYSRKIWI